MSKRFTKLLRDAEKDLDFRIKRKQFQISLALRDRLLERNVTQAALATTLGVSEAAVSKLLKGTENHTIAKLVEVADALNLDVTIDFVEKSRNRRKQTPPAQRWDFARDLSALLEPSAFDLRVEGVGREWTTLGRPVATASNQDEFNGIEPAAA